MNYIDKLVAESFPRTISVQAPLDAEWVRHLLLNDENWSVLLEPDAFRFERWFEFTSPDHAALFCGQLQHLVAGEAFSGRVEEGAEFPRVCLIIHVESINDSLRKAACVANECELRYRMFCRLVSPSELEERAI